MWIEHWIAELMWSADVTNTQPYYLKRTSICGDRGKTQSAYSTKTDNSKYKERGVEWEGLTDWRRPRMPDTVIQSKLPRSHPPFLIIESEITSAKLLIKATFNGCQRADCSWFKCQTSDSTCHHWLKQFSHYSATIREKVQQWNAFKS